MAELVFVTVFNTHICRERLTKRQILRSQTISDKERKTYTCVR